MSRKEASTSNSKSAAGYVEAMSAALQMYGMAAKSGIPGAEEMATAFASEMFGRYGMQETAKPTLSRLETGVRGILATGPYARQQAIYAHQLPIEQSIGLRHAFGESSPLAAYPLAQAGFPDDLLKAQFSGYNGATKKMLEQMAETGYKTQ